MKNFPDFEIKAFHIRIDIPEDEISILISLLDTIYRNGANSGTFVCVAGTQCLMVTTCAGSG